MFGRWWRKQDRPLRGVALPDLDREVSALWGRGPAPAPAAPPADSLDFGSAAVRPRRTQERARRRRRLLVSLLLGLVLGFVLVAGVYYVDARLHPTYAPITGLGERMTFGDWDHEEIFYTDDVSAEPVRRLGAFLKHVGLFGFPDNKSVRLSREGDTYVVGFAMEWINWQDDAVADHFRDLMPRLSRDVFDGAPVSIHLCAREPDSKGRSLPTMRVIGAER